jgi:hypothetical protein
VKPLDEPIDHWVYVHLDESCEALYVGMTSSPRNRHQAHRQSSHWFQDIRSYITYGPFPSARVAHQVEILAIRAHRPRHNSNHTTAAGLASPA